MDIWITTKESPNYEVSNNGRVRNKKTGKISLGWNDGRGYLKVEIHGRAIRVHRLVAKTFFDCDSKDLEINHLDGNKKNNFVGNLEWVPHLVNMRHAHKTGLIKHNGQGGLPKKKIKILETGEIFESINACARHINGDHNHISKCLRGVREKHKGFHFGYSEEI